MDGQPARQRDIETGKRHRHTDIPI